MFYSVFEMASFLTLRHFIAILYIGIHTAIMYSFLANPIDGTSRHFNRKALANSISLLMQGM